MTAAGAWRARRPQAAGEVSVRDRWRAFRDRLLSDPRFQAWASRFPLTRPFARRRARALFDLCAGFVYSQVLLACVRLDVFERLAEGPLTPAELAARVGVPGPSAERLLKAAVSLDLVEARGAGRFGLGALGAALRGAPGVAAMVEHHALVYADLHDPIALLKGEARQTRLGRFWPYASKAAPDADAADAAAAYSALMAASQPMVAQQVLDAYPLRRHRALLDVGGGEGAFAAAAAARAPHLNLTVFDLPDVAARAQARFAAEGLAGRARAVAGSFLADPLPPGADLITLVRILHDHDDPDALAIVRAARAAAPPGGRLLIAEPMAATSGAEPMGEAYFGFYLLAMGSGRPRTPAELKDLVRRAGFRRPRLLATPAPLVARLLVADAG